MEDIFGSVANDEFVVPVIDVKFETSYSDFEEEIDDVDIGKIKILEVGEVAIMAGKDKVRTEGS